MSAALFVVPEGLNDPARPSGGNTYDRQLIDGLRQRGWTVDLLTVHVGAHDAATAQRALAELHDGSLVVIDGLLAAALSEDLVTHSRRLRLVLLVHMPQESPAEQRVASASACVVATSDWTRDWLINCYQLQAQRTRVVHPGVEAADVARPTAGGGRLLCVAALRKHKGQDVLVQALARLRGAHWRCTFVGSLDVDPVFSTRVEMLRDGEGLRDRVRLAGPLTGPALNTVYAQADLLVLPSLMETYGMVITEALARGLPVITSDTGGTSEALGADPGGTVPGLLVPPGDSAALADAIQAWLVDEDLRGRLRAAAVRRRDTLRPWSDTAETMSAILTQVAA